jgi:hypothetical protein
MHCRRIIKTSILMVTTLVSGCWSQDKPIVTSSPLSEEQLSVYRGFLDKFSFLHFRNLANFTVPFDFKGFPDGRPCLRGIELESHSEALRTAHRLGPEITKGRDVRLVNPLEQGKLFQQRDASSGKRKEKLTEDAVKTSSDLDYLVLSELVFDTKHQFAVVKYLSVCGQHCVSGGTLVMEKVDGKWAVSSRRPCAMFVGD